MPAAHDPRPLRRLLVVTGGVGLGNATRIHAILQELKEQCPEPLKIDLAASGRSSAYFAKHPELLDRQILLPAVSYGKGQGQIHLWKLPVTLLRFLSAGLRAFAILSRALKSEKYDAVIVDSNYNLALKFFARGRLLSVNNSDRIVAHKRFLKDAKLSTYLHFHLVERIDHLFQTWIPDLVLSPWPIKEARPKHVIGIGLVVRRCRPASRQAGQVLVMGSGSGLGSVNLAELESFNPKVFGIGLTDLNQWNYKTLPALAATDVAVINAGFSSLSEALVHRKRILAIPLKNHAEQHIVCGFLKARGWIKTSDTHLGQTVKELLQSSNPLAQAKIEVDGAGEAAVHILKALGVSVEAQTGVQLDDPTEDQTDVQTRVRVSANLYHDLAKANPLPVALDLRAIQDAQSTAPTPGLEPTL